jgi:hypothetical protein
MKQHLWLLCGALVLAAGCGGSRGDLAQSGAGGPSAAAQAPLSGTLLPAPSTLQQQLGSPARQGSYVEADLSKTGEDYASNLPHQNYSSSPGFVELSPQYGPGQDTTPAGLAYVMFDFDVAGYDRDPALFYNFDLLAPATLGDLYFGLANWQSDRWDWFPADFGGSQQLPASAPYINFSGDLVVVALAAGVGPIDINWLRLGTLPPVAQLTALDPTGPIPLQVQFDASGSSDSDGTIVKYEWDFDGGGGFIDGGGSPTTQHTYDTVFDGTARVRVTDDKGATSVATLAVQAYDTWLHTWGSSEWDTLFDVAVDGNYIYAVGQTSNPGWGAGYYDLLLLKYRADGQLVWARASGDQDSDIGTAVTIDGAGSIYTVGRLQDGDQTYDSWMEKWDSDGNLLWSKKFGFGNVSEGATGAVFVANALFVSGYTETMHPEGSALVLRIEPDGQLGWARYWGNGNLSQAEDICASGTLFGGASAVCAAGYTFSYGNGDVLFLKYDLAGNLLAEQTWGGSEEERGVAATSSFVTSKTTIAAYQNNGGDYDVLLLGVGNSAARSRWASAEDEYVSSIMAASDGGLHFGGYSYLHNNSLGDAYVQHIDSDDNLASGFYWQLDNSSQARCYGMCYSGGQRMLWCGAVKGGTGSYHTQNGLALTALASDWTPRSLGTATPPDGTLTDGPDFAEALSGYSIDDFQGNDEAEIAYRDLP